MLPNSAIFFSFKTKKLFTLDGFYTHNHEFLDCAYNQQFLLLLLPLEAQNQLWLPTWKTQSHYSSSPPTTTGDRKLSPPLLQLPITHTPSVVISFQFGALFAILEIISSICSTTISSTTSQLSKNNYKELAYPHPCCPHPHSHPAGRAVRSNSCLVVGGGNISDGANETGGSRREATKIKIK